MKNLIYIIAAALLVMSFRFKKHDNSIKYTMVSSYTLLQDTTIFNYYNEVDGTLIINNKKVTYNDLSFKYDTVLVSDNKRTVIYQNLANSNNLIVNYNKRTIKCYLNIDNELIIVE